MPYELPDSERRVQENPLSIEGDEALIRKALSEWENGDPGIPLKEAIDTIRARHDIASQ